MKKFLEVVAVGILGAVAAIILGLCLIIGMMFIIGIYVGLK
jgi:hypothetical protein